MIKRMLCFILMIFISLSLLYSQSSSASSTGTSTQFDTTGFPQWAKDLRRGEIVAFGVFPFTYFLSSFGMDSYRWATHDGDRRYAPWLFSEAGSIDKTQQQRFITLGISIGGAIVIALVDYGIVRYKRYTKEKEYRSLPEGTPIIIRRPMNDETETSDNYGIETP